MGPALPPWLAAERAAAAEAERTGEMGPPLPPALAAERAAAAAGAAPKPSRSSELGGGSGGDAMGPALPPDLAAERARKQPSASPGTPGESSSTQ
jgi:hypothetical protein